MIHHAGAVYRAQRAREAVCRARATDSLADWATALTETLRWLLPRPTPGQVAFEAYYAEVLGQTPNRRPLLALWSAQPPRVRQAWEVAAAAAIGAWGG